jgi:hypothetical protein
MTTSNTAGRPAIRLAGPLSALAAALALLTSAGCSPKAPTLSPIRGQVLVDGKPIVEAVIVLHPAKGDEPGGKKLEARSDAEGRFAIAEGLPPGQYDLTVQWLASRFDGERSVRDGHNLLPERYADPKTSQLHYTVVEGNNEIPPLQLIGE